MSVVINPARMIPMMRNALPAEPDEERLPGWLALERCASCCCFFNASPAASPVTVPPTTPDNNAFVFDELVLLDIYLQCKVEKKHNFFFHSLPGL